MQGTYIWNQFNLHRRKEVIILLLLLLSLKGFNQNSHKAPPGINLPNYDDRLIHYGFQLGVAHSGFRVKHNERFLNQQLLDNVYPSASTGFTIGFLFNLRVSELSDLRFTPYVGFYDRKLNFKYQDDNLKNALASFQSSTIELPLLYKFKSARRRNTRMYMVGGIKTSIEVGAKKKQKEALNITTKSVGFSLEYGLGLDIYYPLFKLAPELRFSYGLTNLLIEDPKNELIHNSIEKISPYTVSVIFFFE